MRPFNQASQMVCECRRGTGGQTVAHYNLPRLYTLVTCSSIPPNKTSKITLKIWERLKVLRSSTTRGDCRRGKLLARGYILCY